MMDKMSGYEITDQDIQSVVKWLKDRDPENANEEFAKEMLLAMKMSYREVGLTDPDSLEKFYEEYKNKG